MVQQGYSKARYRTSTATRRGAAAPAAGEDVAFPAGRATVQAGLRSFSLTKAEQLRFANRFTEYRDARRAWVLGCRHGKISASKVFFLLHRIHTGHSTCIQCLPLCLTS